MKQLLELKLPSIVEARKRKESRSGSMECSSPSPNRPPFYIPQSPESATNESPISPTFSARGHSRFPSSNSSLASSPTMHESLDVYMTNKRPLTEVREEVAEPEEEESSEAADATTIHESDAFNYFDTAPVQEDQPQECNEFNYDLGNNEPFECQFLSGPPIRKLSGDENTLPGMTARLGTRFPSLSRKWAARRPEKSISIAESRRDSTVSRSRANSTRSPSYTSMHEAAERAELQYPPTPARSLFRDARDDLSLTRFGSSPITTPTKDSKEDDDADKFATTPLLPPMMVQIPSRFTDEPFQSPLQSPSVAESPSVLNTPTYGLPSPPLSTKPSLASLHHRAHPFATNHDIPIMALSPTSEIPPIQLSEHADEWSQKLGHANFTIRPEPYTPTSDTLESCKKLREDWFAAKAQYLRHLSRTGEFYSPTSKIYTLTQDKWAQIDAQWRKTYIDTVTRVNDVHGKNVVAESLETGEMSETRGEPSTKMPPLNGPKSEGKFPTIGDGGIVGPLVRAETPIRTPIKRGKKRSFWKFLQGVFDGSVAMGRTSG